MSPVVFPVAWQGRRRLRQPRVPAEPGGAERAGSAGRPRGEAAERCSLRRNLWREKIRQEFKPLRLFQRLSLLPYSA